MCEYAEYDYILLLVFFKKNISLPGSSGQKAPLLCIFVFVAQ